MACRKPHMPGVACACVKKNISQEGNVNLGQVGKVNLGKEGKVNLGQEGKVNLGHEGKLELVQVSSVGCGCFKGKNHIRQQIKVFVIYIFALRGMRESSNFKNLTLLFKNLTLLFIFAGYIIQQNEEISGQKKLVVKKKEISGQNWLF